MDLSGYRRQIDHSTPAARGTSPSSAGGTLKGEQGDNNAFQGEDLDVLADVVYSRLDETGERTTCRPEIESLKTRQDRATGNRNATWRERDYMTDVRRVRAAALLAHGNNDFNVMTKQAAQFYAALKRQGVPHMFYLHQGGHGGAPPDVLVNYWFTRYLYGVRNGVERLPRSWVVREAASCPPRQTTVTGDQSNTATLVVADSGPFRIGFTLTVPQTNADGTTTTTTHVIQDIPDSTHLVLASAVATAPGQKVAATVVSLVCSSANPTPYAEWPDPASRDVTLHLTPGAPARGGLTLAFADPGAPSETLTDDTAIAGITLANAPSSNARLIYQTPPLERPVRISGTPTVSLNLAFSTARANLTAALVSYPPIGDGTILTRGRIDPANRDTDWADVPIRPDRRYRIDFGMQPKDSVVPAGNRLALMVVSSDRDFTIRPAPGTQLTLDLARSSLRLPVVGGADTLAVAD
jgi:X-Pro dipeptidyl-peptidase C-terminal non-catalytic domain/X-Pro dipeptidyl-peptidase (S15 family)